MDEMNGTVTRLERSKCAVLPLVLKGKWFNMIASGEKREEYREPSKYWLKRFHRWNQRVNENVGPVVEFRLGYGKNAPRLAFWCYGCDTTSGMLCYAYTEQQTHPEWGEPETPHLLIRLGGRVELTEV